MTAVPSGLVTAIIALFYTVFLVRRILQFLHARETWKWDRMKGQVTWSMVDEVVVPLGRRSRTEYVPTIRYRYLAARREHESDRVFRGKFTHLTEAQARKWVHRFPPGAEVHVYVNPQDLNEAVLVQGDPTALDHFLFLGLFLVVFGTIVVISQIS